MQRTFLAAHPPYVLYEFVSVSIVVCVLLSVFFCVYVCPQPQRGKDPVDLLSPGCSVEVQDSQDPAVAWAAEVEENVGGRLRLRLFGTEGLPDPLSSLWLYYFHPRLHPPGWAKENACTLRPHTGQPLPGRSRSR